jgi:peptidoglycan/xylan/chitin deacetylase (PgdA/CDA1 family)
MIDFTRRFSLALTAALIVAAGLLWATASWRSEQRWSQSTGEAPEAALPTPETEPELPESVRVPILVYHNVRATPPANLSAYDRQYEVTPEQFSEQMNYLVSEGFEPVTVRRLTEYLRTGRGEWPERPVAITFDDGRRSQIELAWPIMERLGLTATFFVFTNAPDRNDNYLTWSELAGLRGAGNEIASHTVLHPYLTKSDDEDLARELTKSRTDIETGVGAVALSLAYPFGLSDERVRLAAGEAGYSAARGLRHYVEIRIEDLMDLPGYIVTGDLDYLKAVLAGRVEE